jgi:alkylation response protein AidB-like acyl-CoA dehydrogenase
MTATQLRFAATELSAEEEALQQEVRDFLDAELPVGSHEPSFGMATGSSREFSRKLAARGWVGMALPKEYGGGDRSAVERFLVVEELLRRGAPLEHHWTADRQYGPLINRFGTEAQKHEFLPKICAAEISFCIGMSEPDSGSDLASVQSRAVRIDGGWQLTGTKIWTSNAHRADYCVVLCRTAEAGDRHQGLSQLIVDLHSDGVSINPIPFLDGTAEFNEVVYDHVFVPADRLLGEPGMGWAQVTSELSFERGGPDRWMSPFQLVQTFLAEQGHELPAGAASFLGESLARWWALRQLSLCVARMIDEGRAPALEAAISKDLGTQFEQQLMARIQTLVDLEPSPESLAQYERLLARAVLISPSWAIRGGTNEILRTVISRGLR